MNILLDTNAFLWAAVNSDRLQPVGEMLLDSGNTVFVSVVSWWEIAIKRRIGKLDVSLPELVESAHGNDFRDLPLLRRHAEALADIPIHHKDPFDHMILAQAMAENMLVVTGDRIFEQYTRLAVII